jgi:serine/threonine-protein phosphatase 2A regulatory subunit B
MDFSKKVLHAAWHPQENILAVGGLNNLYIYASQ